MTGFHLKNTYMLVTCHSLDLNIFTLFYYIVFGHFEIIFKMSLEETRADVTLMYFFT